MTKPNPVYADATIRRRNVQCSRCGSVFQVAVIEGATYEKVVVCDACESIASDATVKARIGSQGDCNLCGRAIVLENGVPTHLEAERDEWHRPLYVTEGM